MSVAAEQNATVEIATVAGLFESGLVGTIGVRVDDNQGNTVIARTTTGIVQLDPADAGVYAATITAPGTVGQYTVIFDDDNGTYATEDLIVVAAGGSTGTLPAVPSAGPDQPALGPCVAWTDADAVAACDTDITVSSDTQDLLDQVAVEASMLLYELSAQRFSGQCDRTVRPCRTRPRCTGVWGSLEEGPACGCGRLDRVLLPGYPVTSILTVRIDGDEIDPDTYRLDDWRYLSRIRDPADPDTQLFWPACQNLDLDDTQDGTFSIRYLAGVNPPPIGQRAAAELAAQLYKACPGTAAEGDCQLPVGVQEIVRQGVTIQVQAFTGWGFNIRERAWRTGLPLTDAFLNTYNPNGARRPAAVWSPDGPQYARQLGTAGGS